MISSLAYEDTFERAKAIGARGLLYTPFLQDKLLMVFGEALSYSQYAAAPPAQERPRSR